MELLAILVDKFGLFALVPVAALAFFGLTGVFGLVVLVLRPRWAGRRSRWLGKRGLASSLVLLGLVLTANGLLFETIVRVALARVEAATGVAVTFTDGAGSLLSGSVRLQGARVARTSDATATFDMTIEEVELQLSLSGLLHDPIEIERVTARGVRGSYNRLATPEPLPVEGGYVVAQLRVDDAVLRVRDETLGAPLTGVVTVDSLACDGFRRDMALFDLGFRSAVSGRFNGQQFDHTPGESEAGHESHWHLEGVPLMVLGAGSPLVSALGGSLVTVDVDSRWSAEEGEMLEMAWRVGLGQLQPPALPVGGDALGGALDWLRDHADLELTVPLRFPLARFERARTLSQVGLLRALAPALGRALAEQIPLPGGGGELLDRLLDLGGRLGGATPAPVTP